MVLKAEDDRREPELMSKKKGSPESKCTELNQTEVQLIHHIRFAHPSRYTH